MAKKKRKTVYSGIGGEAVLEGVMMRNRRYYAIAVRKPDGTIDVQRRKLKYDPHDTIRRIPFIRGIISFVDSLMLGMDVLSYSSSFYEEEEETKLDKALKKVFGKNTENIVMGFTVFCSIIFAVLLFMLLPYGASELLGKYVENQSLILLTEGILRLVVFLLYVGLIALSKDIRRLYQYHGAEHKCINCIESGRPLTVKNVRKTTRFHKRCGTSFMLLIVMIGIILCFFIRTDSITLRIIYRLLMIPLVAGISYELLRLAGSKDSIFLDIISAPGLWLQRLTTREPDDEMIEVAIASVEAVFNWRKFEKRHFKRKTKDVPAEAVADQQPAAEAGNVPEGVSAAAAEPVAAYSDDITGVTDALLVAAQAEEERIVPDADIFDDIEFDEDEYDDQITIVDYKEVSDDTYVMGPLVFPEDEDKN